MKKIISLNIFSSRLLMLSAVILTALATALTGCIKNDVPYPHIQANFRSISAEGQSQSASIDSVNRVVTFYFPEEANIYSVKVKDYTLTPDATVVDNALSQSLDLSSDKTVTLRLYYDYDWTITGVRNIERYFTVAGQIGSAIIDEPAHRVVAYVSETTDIKAVQVQTFKLGPSAAEVSDDLTGKTVDFTSAVHVKISDYGHDEDWTIYIEQTDSSVTTVRVDAWTCVAWVYGQAEAGADNSVEYRLKGDSQWTRVPDSWLTIDGGSFYARIIHLNPLTTYEARAVSGDEAGEVIEFTTGMNVQLPNSDMDDWNLDGKVWNPWADGDESFWDTGNKGATTLGSSNSYPTEDTPSGKGLAACLETRFIGIGIVGKLGAGNVFVGKYVRTDGTNGILNMGREFTQRPTKVRGYLKYTTAPISSVSSGLEYMKGQPDTCIVWCALVDLDAPLEIRTNPSNRQLFDENASYVVAYGRVQYGHNVDGYTPFEFELNYRSTQRTPKYLMLAASASKYGDYFTGGNGAVMYVDDFELEYDY